MKTQRFYFPLLLINFVMLAYLALTSLKPEQDIPRVIKCKAFELTDDKGMKRATIKTEPGGEVVFRLHNSKGEVRVKLGAGDEGSGLVLLNDSTNPGLQALAKHEGGTLVLFDGKGNRHPVKQ